MQTDEAGIISLLQRLELPLKWQIHLVEPSPALEPDAIDFATSFEFLQYFRLKSGAIYLQEPHAGHQAQIWPDKHQLQIWAVDTPQQPLDTHRLWHNFIRYSVSFYLSYLGYTPLHAAALIDPSDRVWLFAGQSGAGKSTLTVGAIEAGWKYLSDDGLILEVQDERVVAHSWWGSSLLDPILIKTYPHLEPYLGEFIGRRQLINLQTIYRDRSLPQAIPDIIAFPYLSNEVRLAKLEAIAPGSALAQLMSHTAPWLMVEPRSHLSTLRILCEQCSYFTLHLGSTLRTMPDLLSSSLSS